MKRLDMRGVRYGGIIAVADVGMVSSGDRKWSFLCDCGRTFEASGYAVRAGVVSTCSKCGAERTRLSSVIHGRSETREFSTWTDIQTRCNNPNTVSYKDYGGRGIRVCDRWLTSFESFLADMGQRPSDQHSIERDDVDGNYEPSNCRWATRAEQGRNKRNTRMVEINGTTKRLQDWAKENGLLPSTLHIRLRQGGTGLALLAPSVRGGSVEFNGIRDTHAGWSRRTGIKTSTIAMRLTKYQWPVSVALTKGALL